MVHFFAALVALSAAYCPAATRHTTRASTQLDVAPQQRRVAVDVVNQGSTIREPILTVTPGSLKEHRANFHANGLPNVIEILVPEGAATLWLRVRSAPRGTETLEMYLYDCTSGECFSYDIGFPAHPEHTMLVRRPTPGRWIAAVNAAPFPTAPGGFVLEEVMTSGAAQERRMARPLLHAQRWTTDVAAGSATPSTVGERPIFFVELLDAALDKDEAAYPWNPSPTAVKLRDRPVALGTLIVHR